MDRVRSPAWVGEEWAAVRKKKVDAIFGKSLRSGRSTEMMKPRSGILLCGGFLVAGTGLFIASFRLQGDYAAASTSITKLEQAVREATRIDVLTLSPTPNAKDDDTFTTAGYGETYFITASHTLDVDSTNELKAILADHVLTTGFSAMCHTPGQVLRFYSGPLLLLETSLCLECTNLQFYVYPFVPASVTISEREVAEMGLPMLEAFLKTIKESG